MTTLDTDFVRSQFPALTDPALAGWVHAENAGGSYPSRQALDVLCDFYATSKVQVGYPFPLSQLAASRMHDGPARLAPWLGVTVDHVHVGPSTTQNTHVLAHAFAEHLDADAVVLVTEQDHEANSGPWRRMGLPVREWRVDPTTGSLDVAELDRLLAEGRVALAAVPWVSNVLGEVNDVADWCARIRAAGAVSVVDAVAMAPHGLPDVPATGADVLLLSTYKTWGPHQGVMVVAPELVRRLPNQGHDFNAGVLAKRLVPAGPDHAQVAAVGGVADYLQAVAEHHGLDGPTDAAALRTLFRSHESAVVAALLQHLAGRDDVRLLGPADPATRVPTVSFVARRAAADVVAALAEHRVMAGGGHFYARRLVTAMGVDPEHGVVRLSLLHTTTTDEVARIVTALDAVLGRRA